MVKKHTILFKGFVVLCLFMTMFAYACANDTNETSHNFSFNTCSITFDIKQAGKTISNAQMRQSFDLELDCNEIAMVNADVFNMAGVPLKSGGPWSCDYGTGTIQNVPAGTRGVVVVLCRSPQGDVVYRGESFEINLTPGQTVSAGSIEADSFVPVLLLPVDGESDNVVNGNVQLSWEAVKGAVGYGVEVVNIGNSLDSDSPYTYTTSDTSYRTHDLIDMENDYAWRVRAFDSEGNQGSWSEQRNFKTDDNEIPSARIINPGNNSQVFGEIQFQAGFPMDAFGYDFEDGTNVQFEWISDVDGAIGTGESFTFSLSPGQHIITLTVTDQAGAVGWYTIQITVLAEASAVDLTGQWNYFVGTTIQEDNCPVGDVSILEGSCDIAVAGQGNYNLTFSDYNICMPDEGCTFLCTLSNDTYSCIYEIEVENVKVTDTIEFSVISGNSASGQGTSQYQRDDDNSDPGYDYQCQWDYNISFTK